MTLCTVLLLCNLVFIWGNSLLPAEVSGQISGTLKALLDGVFTPGEAVPSGGDGLLRKCAHFAEFGALGLLLGWLFGMLGKKRLPAFALGVAAACIDETIQIFTGRGPQVQDVWLDVAGGTAGLLAMLALVWLLRCLFRPRKRPAADV